MHDSDLDGSLWDYVAATVKHEAQKHRATVEEEEDLVIAVIEKVCRHIKAGRVAHRKAFIQRTAVTLAIDHWSRASRNKDTSLDAMLERRQPVDEPMVSSVLVADLTARFPVTASVERLRGMGFGQDEIAIQLGCCWLEVEEVIEAEKAEAKAEAELWE